MKQYIIGLLFIILCLTSVFAAPYIVDPSSNGFGSKNRTENLKNMTRNWLYNNATFLVQGQNGVNYFAVPWFDNADSTYMNGSGMAAADLHSCQNSTWHGNLTSSGYSNISFCSVTDEFSRAAYSILFGYAYGNDTYADAIINSIVAMNDSGNSYTGSRSGGGQVEWVTYWYYNTSLGYWLILKNQVADSANDADAYSMLALALINQTPVWNSTNRQKAGQRLEIMCPGLVNQTYYDASLLSLKNRVNPGDTVRWWPGGGSSVAGGISNNDFTWPAYFGPILEALAACRKIVGDTGAFNYTDVAEDTFQVALIGSNYTAGGPFWLMPGRSVQWQNVSSNGQPWALCTNSCTNAGEVLGTEDPDSMRHVNICRAAWVWQNLTGHTLRNSTAYCASYASLDCQSATQYGYRRLINGSAYSSCLDSGFRAVGLGMSLAFLQNQSNMDDLIGSFNGHYGTCTTSLGLCEMDGGSQNSFGVYDKSFGLTDIPYAIGLADCIFNTSICLASAPPPDTTAPSCTWTNTSITNSSALITASCDEAANLTVRYGTTINLGTVSTNTTSASTNYLNITSLTSSTLYYWNATSCDGSGNCANQTVLNFTTLTTTAPGCVQTQYGLGKLTFVCLVNGTCLFEGSTCELNTTQVKKQHACFVYKTLNSTMDTVKLHNLSGTTQPQYNATAGYYYFNGSSFFTTTGGTMNNASANTTSIAARIYVQTCNATKIVSRIAGEGTTRHPNMLMQTNCSVGISYRNTSGTTFTSYSSAVGLNSWSHFTGVINGSHVAIYINGTFYAQTATFGDPALGAGTTRIGNSDDSNNINFTGFIDDVKVWNISLTGSQVFDNWLGYDVAPLSLVAAYEFSNQTSCVAQN